MRDTTSDTAAETTAETITLAGRTFRPVGVSTFRHQVWMMPHVHAAGLDEPVADARAFTARVYAAGVERTLLLLGGALEEVGVPWTPDGAERNAQFFADLSAPADTLALHGALVRVLLDFFSIGTALSPTSRASSGGSSGAPAAVPSEPPSSTASSGTPAPAAPGTSPRRRRQTRQRGAATAGPSTSASGATSSASSPSTTPPE